MKTIMLKNDDPTINTISVFASLEDYKIIDLGYVD